MAQHTLIRKLEQVFTLQRPLQVSNSTLRDCFAVFTGGLGVQCTPVARCSLRCKNALPGSHRFTDLHGVGVAGPQKEVEPTFPVLRVPALRPLDFPGRGRRRGPRFPLSGADGHRSAGRGASAVRSLPPAFSPLCSRGSPGSHRI